MSRRFFSMLLLLVLGSALVAGCGTKETGTLQFVANGEDFVRQGFVSKDGWQISFEHVYVNLVDIEGYQTDPPYDPHAGSRVKAAVTLGLDGSYLVDLAKGGEDAAPILVGEAAATVGHYNTIHWKMARATDGPAEGYSLLIVGTAEKDGQVVRFTIGIETEYSYTCGEYVGDERKGFLDQDGTADLEMTFHFDHIFGDAETPMDDELNQGAPGFQPFADLVKGAGDLQVDLAELENALSGDFYQMLLDILPTLGHVGEGHCHSEAH